VFSYKSKEEKRIFSQHKEEVHEVGYYAAVERGESHRKGKEKRFEVLGATVRGILCCEESKRPPNKRIEEANQRPPKKSEIQSREKTMFLQQTTKRGWQGRGEFRYLLDGGKKRSSTYTTPEKKKKRDSEEM